MALAITIGLLVAGGVFMMLRRGMLRIIVGFILLSHGVNLLLVTAGGPQRRKPAIGDRLDPGVVADAVPQAFVLTAVVIAFAITVFLLVLAVIGTGDDDTELELDGRETETPEFFEPEALRAYRKHGPADYHAYLDRADDTEDGTEDHTAEADR
ncbi:MAG TPA: cation:proton antiporter subunit C [Marmoricola sp.]|nr:cation:proton antiporter subunit C [Marmoricola sp.]